MLLVTRPSAKIDDSPDNSKESYKQDPPEFKINYDLKTNELYADIEKLTSWVHVKHLGNHLLQRM